MQVGPLGIALLMCFAVSAGGVYVLSAYSAERGADTLQQIETTGVVRIGYANEAPYGYLDTATGEITGEAPEIARHILSQMGATSIKPVVTEFGSLIPGLKAGRFDLIAAGMYIKPQRCQEIDFSNPTYRIGEAFIVRRGNPLELHSFTDVAETPEARIGVVGGAIEDRYARDAGVPDDRIVRFPDNISALTGVWSGRVDAFAATVLTVEDLLRKADTEELERAKPFSDPVTDGQTVKGYGAFGFRQQDDEFRRAFNAHLDKFIGTEEHLNLVGKFGISEETLPGDVTAEELCEGR